MKFKLQKDGTKLYSENLYYWIDNWDNGSNGNGNIWVNVPLPVTDYIVKIEEHDTGKYLNPYKTFMFYTTDSDSVIKYRPETLSTYDDITIIAEFDTTFNDRSMLSSDHNMLQILGLQDEKIILQYLPETVVSTSITI